MNRAPFDALKFDDVISHGSSPRVPTPPAPAAVQAERQRLAEMKRARQAVRQARGMS